MISAKLVIETEKRLKTYYRISGVRCLKMKNLRVFKMICNVIIFSAIFSGVSAAVVYADSIKVSPGAFCIQGAPVGEDTDLGVDLVISSTYAEEMTFQVEAMNPSDAAAKRVKGYDEIPDPSWFYLDKNTVTVKPGSDGHLRMHLKIPREEKYYNQHWIVFVKVVSQQGLFLFELKPNYMIETETRSDTDEKPFGILGLTPSAVKLSNTGGGKGSFKLRNNDGVAHTYKISSFIPKDLSKQAISVTDGCQWVGDEKWIKVITKKLKLRPGETNDISIKENIPKNISDSGKKMEGLVFVDSEDGHSGFVRVYINSDEK
jgi:hypothetical protein